MSPAGKEERQTSRVPLFERKKAADMDDLDPTYTDPDKYKTIFENDRVRVLDYQDTPGVKTKPHRHPNSVLLTLSNFRRRLTVGDDVKEVALETGRALWRPAEIHVGENIGTTDTHVVFVELKD
jgi:beta-alanine degradation protein BauB